jgi:hypothetical protein
VRLADFNFNFNRNFKLGSGVAFKSGLGVEGPELKLFGCGAKQCCRYFGGRVFLWNSGYAFVCG